MRNILRIVFSFALVFGALAFSSLFISPQTSGWYAGLVKPDFIPPDQIFAPAWIISYLLMALALVRVCGSSMTGASRRWFFAFGIQLLLSVLWVFLFFSLHAVSLAVVAVIVLWFVVLILTLNSWDIDRISFWLLVPYFAWITFAMILGVAVWWVN